MIAGTSWRIFVRSVSIQPGAYRVDADLECGAVQRELLGHAEDGVLGSGVGVAEAAE